ncbi:MAG TPA: response regulator [Oscillatoriaceae cyanobacterium M33_DOE_052]|uniref:histidine kinase n=1 Tax=Planktothricoides sp. SpSt-374 TaxID=2282167 RepID=A0A7C3VRB9_9CYAN|nr:response regulator [Oscillatoriaceae cyanobacterium M33_DOE_052]
MNRENNSVSRGNILIIDDEPNNLRVLLNCLTDNGYDVRGVLTGEMGLKAALSEPPDLVLLDIMMPQMDGYQVGNHFKNIAELRDIPIIFVSAKYDTLDKVKAFRVGGVDYIMKPFQIEEVLARIENHLRLRRLQDELEEQNLLLQAEISQRQAAELALQEQNAQLQLEIRERERAEAELAKLNEDLARSNSELAQFVSIASHDLRSPLTTVKGYGQLFKMRHAQSLEAEGQRYINRILDGCDRMLNLIDDLLQYSRLGKAGEQFSPVRSAEAIEEACQNLSLEITTNQAQIICRDLPVVMADFSQLRQLFQNLIGNAIKYRGEANPLVEVTAINETDHCLFAVKDNGIGIAPESFPKIFQMFKRLHGPSEYPGTGIGLAICQKIVQLHGGRIWVESAPGQGSIFYFSIPVLSADIPPLLVKNLVTQ